jgi:hypothetical protein
VTATCHRVCPVRRCPHPQTSLSVLYPRLDLLSEAFSIFLRLSLCHPKSRSNSLEVLVSLSNFHKRYFVSSFSSAEYTFQGLFFLFLFCLCHFVRIASDRVSSFPSCARSLSFRIHIRYPSHRHNSARSWRLRAILCSNRVGLANWLSAFNSEFSSSVLASSGHAKNLLARWT